MLEIRKYEPEFPPIEFFITRFFVGDKCLFAQETKFSLPTFIYGDVIEIFDETYVIESREFGFNEDAFFTVYYMRKRDEALR